MARLSHGPPPLPVLSKRGTKRKRDCSSEAAPKPKRAPLQPGKRAYVSPPPAEDPTEVLVQQQLHQESQRSAEKRQSDYATSKESNSALTVSRIEEIIKNEFATEILLKHQEIRLIEQELVKVNVCYEQLRRVSAMPFNIDVPAPALLSGAYADGSKTTRASAAYAVDPLSTNGPYMQHYKTWLIQHPQFGNMPASTFAPATVMAPPPRTRRAGDKQNQHEMGTAHAAFTGIVMHRDSDGQDVVLICAFCGKRGFTKATGIMNHCLIVHKYKLRNHQEAADQFGHPVVRDESGHIVGPLTAEPITADESTSQSPLQSPGLASPLHPSVDPSGTDLPVGEPFSPSRSHLRQRPAGPFSTANLAQRIKARRGGIDLDAVLEEIRAPIDSSMHEDSDDDVQDGVEEACVSQRPARERKPSRRARGLDGIRDGSSEEDIPQELPERLQAAKGYRGRLGRSPAPLTFSSSPVSQDQQRPSQSDSDSSIDDLRNHNLRLKRLRNNQTSRFLQTQIIPSSQPEADADGDTGEPSLVSDDGEEVISHDLSSEAEHEESHATAIMDSRYSVVEDSQDETVILHPPEKSRVRKRIAAEHRPSLRGDLSRTRRGTIIKRQERHVSMMEKRRNKSQSVHR